ncbi:C4-dicarboxylate ABC transporter [Fulvimarina endophytica]|uniref:C4-dicarboxylate ABC transporter n=1 Tax=Fulvimarina endophytica TaxID=2293836 RepID=A0A371XAA3_9HYPH|nr:C4-dicarboxylate ABC transporter [Fulvimarina endophytica]
MKLVTFKRCAGMVVGAALALGATQGAKAQEFINVLTGGTSGVYYPLGVALSEIYGENMDGVRVQVQSTKASVENLNLLHQHRGEIAFALGDSVALAYQGDAEAGFPEPLTDLRAIGSVYPNFIQIVASADSGVKTLADLKGKRVSVGAPKSGTELNARAILAAAGMSYDDFAEVEYLPYAESAELIKNRQLDATLQSSGLGVAFIKDLAASLPISIVEIPNDVAAKLPAPYQTAEIPAGTYDGQDATVATVSIPNLLVTHDEVGDEEAYEMTKQLFTHLDVMVAAHNAAKAIDVKTASKDLPIPLHPGAERYYKEAGAQ